MNYAMELCRDLQMLDAPLFLSNLSPAFPGYSPANQPQKAIEHPLFDFATKAVKSCSLFTNWAWLPGPPTSRLQATSLNIEKAVFETGGDLKQRGVKDCSSSSSSSNNSRLDSSCL